MSNLKLGALTEERPVKLTIELPAAVHRDLITYGQALAREIGAADSIEPARLIAPMVARFMETDRGFRRVRRQSSSQPG